MGARQDELTVGVTRALEIDAVIEAEVRELVVAVPAVGVHEGVPLDETRDPRTDRDLARVGQDFEPQASGPSRADFGRDADQEGFGGALPAATARRIAAADEHLVDLDFAQNRAGEVRARHPPAWLRHQTERTGRS